MAISIAVLMWLHVFSAIGWMGAGLVFGMVITPVMRALSPATRSEVILKLFPKYIRFVQAFIGATLVFGVILAAVMSNGNMAIFAPTNSFGLFITTGAILALVTAAVAMGVVIPSAKKVYKLTEAMVKNPGPPPAELLKASARMGKGAVAGIILLVLVLICMVAAPNIGF